MKFRFPTDLVDLQEEWLRTYDALAALPGGAGATALRRRLILLSCRLHAHPYWSAPGRSRAAGTALRRQARRRTWVRAA
ncbi:hypothetical protein NOD94_004940 [Streptomyces sp. Isolate_45]|nr:hypothetical protein [Streptomyces sp. Isolate_45]MDA5279918.1 hypothetical protein [Streptomyces sp. Isolate_45]